jgi:hypothetical protein
MVIPTKAAPFERPSAWRIGLDKDGTPVALIPWPSDSPRGEGTVVILDGGVTAQSALVPVDAGQGRRVDGAALAIYDATANLKSRGEFEGVATVFRGIGDSTKIYVLLDQAQRNRVELGEYNLDGRYRPLGHGDRSLGFIAFHAYRLSNGALAEFGYSDDGGQSLAAIRRWSPDLKSVEMLESGRDNQSRTYGEVIPTGKPNEFVGGYSLLFVSPPAPVERFGVVLDFMQVD